MKREEISIKCRQLKNRELVNEKLERSAVKVARSVLRGGW